MKLIGTKSLILIALFLTISLTASVRAQIAEEAVMGCWLFEDGSGDIVTDSSGNGYDATLVGTADWTDGKYGNGVELQSGQVTVPGTEETFQLTTYSILAWVQPENTGGFQGIMHKEEGGVSGRTFLMYVNPTGIPTCSMTQGATNSDFPAKTPVTDGNWHHIAITFDEDSRLAQIYVNGVMEASKEYPDDTPQHGAVVNFNKTNYRGVIDEVLITNIALSDEDILIAMEGLEDFIGGAAVKPSGKMALTWGAIKTE